MKKKVKHSINKLTETSKSAVAKRRKKKASPDDIERSGLPRITNETVAEHREEVLASARKYIYPLQHSRHRIVIISLSLFIIAVVVFFSYTLLALYRFHANSTFIYRVTQVIPFPIAKAGPSFVSYENYLFELRRYMHYYTTQQKLDFENKADQGQLIDYQKRALEGVIDDAYVKQLAKEHNVSVSRGDINDQISLLKGQSRLGGSDQVFEDVLREFWDWSVDDFRRELQQQLLAQKVVSKLDTKTHTEAEAALAKLQSGTDFAELAKQVSEDEATKAAGGDFGLPIEMSNRDIQPKVLEALFKLQPNETSGIIETPLGLEIVKVYENNNGKLKASHIFFAFESIDTYLKPVKKENPPSRYIGL